MRRVVAASFMLICGSLAALADKPPPVGPFSPFGDIPVAQPTIEERLDAFPQELSDIDDNRVAAMQARDPTAIDRLLRDQARLSEIEVELTDMRRPIAAHATNPALILFENPDGSVYSRTREDARNEAGERYDNLLTTIGRRAILERVPDHRQVEMEIAIDTGFGRPLFVELEMANARANQQTLRQRETDRFARIEGLLAYVRAIAQEVVATHDVLVAIRDGAGGSGGSGDGGAGGGVAGSGACNATAQPPNANICLYQSFPLTGYASLLGFSVSSDAEYPLRGNYVCVSNSAFWVVEGSAMRHFVCDTVDSCRETRCLAIMSSTPTGPASTRNVLENGAVMETERAQ